MATASRVMKAWQYFAKASDGFMDHRMGFRQVVIHRTVLSDQGRWPRESKYQLTRSRPGSEDSAEIPKACVSRRPRQTTVSRPAVIAEGPARRMSSVSTVTSLRFSKAQ